MALQTRDPHDQREGTEEQEVDEVTAEEQDNLTPRSQELHRGHLNLKKSTKHPR